MSNIFEANNTEELKQILQEKRNQQRNKKEIETSIKQYWKSYRPVPGQIESTKPIEIELTNETKNAYIYNKLDEQNRIIGCGSIDKTSFENWKNGKQRSYLR